VNAVVTQSGLPGRFILPGYGFIAVGGGGGGGAGLDDEDIQGSGGQPGRGEGGTGGVLTGFDASGTSASAYATAGISVGGGGGGGAGIPLLTEGFADGGWGADGLFAVIITKTQECNPVDPICGCRPRKCPKKVDYKQLMTGGNDPKFNPAIALAMYIKGSLGRPGYRKLNYSNLTLNAFGSYDGAPGGSRAPPKNSFN
jgi:hypothetical protein